MWIDIKKTAQSLLYMYFQYFFFFLLSLVIILNVRCLGAELEIHNIEILTSNVVNF